MTPPARRPVPINESEAIIEAFWDEHLSPLRRYTLRAARGDAGPATGTAPLGPVGPDQVTASQFWCWVTLAWSRPAAQPRRRPAALLAFERELNVPLEGYDRLVVRAACPKHVHLTLVATIDGRERTLLRAAPGTGKAHEFEARVRGQRLEHLRLEVASVRDGPDEVWLYWIGCAQARRRAAMLAQPATFTPDWENWLLPEGAPIDAVPRFGFYFDAAELEALRRKALSPLYRPLLDQLRAQAHAAMTDPRPPEAQIGKFLAAGDVWSIQSRERDAGTRSFHLDAPVCAFVGLIDRDPACLRFAARVAVSLAHTETWAPHFMESFPGSTWDTRGFPESHVCAGLALALDWAGACFTPAGEHLVRYAIATKGLPRAREAFLQYEYMWDCNQHHMVGLGRLLGLLVLHRAWPRTLVEIDVFERDLQEIIDRYIQADGSTHEGVGYWSNSFRSTMPGLIALARFRGRPVADLVPAKLRAMDAYIASLLSTTGEPGSYLPIADTVGDAVAIDAISALAHGVGGPLWRGLMADCLRRGKKVKRDWTFDGCFAVIFGPEQCPADEVNLPAFTKLAKAGMASSFRRLDGESVRLFLVGAMANAGHCHRDKGSFILEAGGEGFAIDRGAVPYEDAAHLPFMKSEPSHNLAVPDGGVQQNPSPHACDWDATGDATAVRAEVDTSATWLPPVTRCRRRIESPTPGRIEITDEFELTEARAVTFFLHTPLAASAAGPRGEIRGRVLTLTVSAPWAEDGVMEPCGVNWNYTPIHRLAFRSRAAKSHRLVTVLELTRRQG